jgi:hypothetical protein
MEAVSINCSNPQVYNHAAVVALVGMANTASTEPAVVISLQDAGFTLAAVVTTHGLVANADGAVTPRLLLLTLQRSKIACHFCADEEVETEQPMSVQGERGSTVDALHGGSRGMVEGEHIEDFIPQCQVSTKHENAKCPLVIALASKVRGADDALTDERKHRNQDNWPLLEREEEDHVIEPLNVRKA